jgi:hypothetical protein
MKQQQKQKHKTKLNQNPLTFTKRLVILILWLSIVWVTWSYILATIAVIKYGESSVVESLSERIVEALIATILGYLCKAYFETKNEEKNRIQEKQIDLDSSQEELQDDPDPTNRNYMG